MSCSSAWRVELTVVNPNKVQLIAQSRRKTDKVDAQILRELLRLGGPPQSGQTSGNGASWTSLICSGEGGWRWALVP
jgi:hypothetical protein